MHSTTCDHWIISLCMDSNTDTCHSSQSGGRRKVIHHITVIILNNIINNCYINPRKMICDIVMKSSTKQKDSATHVTTRASMVEMAEKRVSNGTDNRQSCVWPTDNEPFWSITCLSQFPFPQLYFIPSSSSSLEYNGEETFKEWGNNQNGCYHWQSLA